MTDLVRNKGRITKTLMLLEMATGSPKDQRSLADPVGVTPQAISDYLSKMKKEGLVTIGDDGPRPTMKGVDQLHQDLLELKEFVDGSIGKLDIIRSIDAIAMDRIDRGDRVNLIMEDGLLCAVKKGSGSTGIAERDALPGEMLPISKLSGMVEMESGTLRMIEIEPARRGGGRGRITKEQLLELSSVGTSSFRIAALDMEAMALLKRSSIEPDLEMPPPEAVLSCSIRGLDLISVGPPFAISTLIRALDKKDRDLKISRAILDRIHFNQNCF